MNRPKRGYILMKGKKHFIYEGLNVIGRQKEATFTIPDINISHQHSVIVIVDNHHYLSDTNSCNGTFLKELKLSPMQLYELNNGDVIKFGLINSTYFKLENDADLELETVENSLTQVEDNIFNVATQLYNFSAPNIKQDVDNKSLDHNYTVKIPLDSLGSVSINDLPTQLTVDPNDSYTKNEAAPINNADKQKQASITDILINDLPTQVVVHEKDDDSSYVSDVENANSDHRIPRIDIIEDTIIGDNNNGNDNAVGDERQDENSNESADLARMQTVTAQHASSESHSELFVQKLRRRVRNVISSSDDELLEAGQSHRKKVQECHDENSNESVDLLTMQPVATQHFSSESQSQLFVHDLQRRVRNVISSSEDEYLESNARRRKKNSKRKSPHKKDMDVLSSDDETDMETSSTHSQKEQKRSLTKRSKSVTNTDSDGENSSTDAEEELKKISALGESITDLNVAAGSKAEEREEMPSTGMKNESAMLNDSDVIPTTQPVDSRHRHTAKSVSQITNFEASVPFDSSFNLILTNSPSTAADQNAETETEKQESSAMDRESRVAEDEQWTNGHHNKPRPDPESQRTQLDVSFDEDNLGSTEREDFERPPNPLVNILNATAPSNSPEKTVDSIEETLLKMFQSQTPATEKTDGDVDNSVFLQPTQSIMEEDLFAVPTQKIIPGRTCRDSKGSVVESVEQKRNERTETVGIEKENDEDASAKGDDVFSKPTQFILNEEKNKHDVSKVAEDDIFLKPTEASAEEDDVFLKPTQFIVNQEENKDDVSKAAEDDVFLKPTKASAEEDDVFLKPTQFIVNQEKNKDDVSKAAEDDVFLKPTQFIVNPEKKKDDVSNAAEDDVFLKPTQLILNEAKNKNDVSSRKIVDETRNETSLKGIENAVQEDCEDDDVFMQPTQIILNTAAKNAKEGDNLRDDKTDKSSVTDGDGTEESASKISVDDDIFLQPTQIISETTAKATESKNEQGSLAKKLVKQQFDADQDVFLQPTQLISFAVTSEKGNIENSSRNPHSSKEGKTGENSVSGPEKSTATSNRLSDQVTMKLSDAGDDDIFLKPTQKIKIIDKTADEGSNRTAILNEAQSLEEDVFSQPTQIFGDVPPSPKRKGSNENKEDAIEIVENDIFQQQTDADVANENISESSNDRKFKTIIPDSHIGSDHPTISNPKQSETERIAGLREDKSLRKVTEAVVPKATAFSNETTELGATETSNVEVQSTPVVKRRKSRNVVEGTAKRRKTRNAPDSSEDIQANNEVVKFSGRRSKRKQSSDGTLTPTAASDINKNTEISCRSSKKDSRDERIYVIQEISDSDHRLDKAGDGSEDEFEQTVKQEISPKAHRSSKRSVPPPKVRKRTDRTGTRSRRNKAGDAEAKEIDDIANTSPSVERLDLESAVTSAKQRKVHESTSVAVNTEDKHTEPTRKSGRGRTKQKRPDKIEDEVLLPSDSSNKTDCEFSNVSGTRKTRAIKKGKNIGQESDYDDSGESSGALDFKEVKSNRKTLPAVSLIPSTPQRTKRKLKPKVVFTMLDSPELETIIRSLGGFVVESVDACTVLLTSSVKRSLKLLSAIGQGKPICSPKWLHESKKAHAFLDPWNYILEDDEAEKKWNFSLGESLRRGVERKLLANCTFQIMVNTAQDVLKGSIESCGGKCVSRAPSKDNRTNFIIIASPENKNKYAKFLKEQPAPKIVAAEAIFDGVLRQELHFEDHLLT